MADLHLDDDALNGLLDSDSGAAPGQDHVAGCGHCAARLDALRQAARLVAGPVPAPDPAVREAAIAAAIAAADPGGARVPSLDDRRRRRLTRAPLVWIGAAAALVIVLAGVGMLGDTRSDNPVALQVPAEESMTAGGALEHLGAVDDDLALQALVRDRLGGAGGAGGGESGPMMAQDSDAFDSAPSGGADDSTAGALNDEAAGGGGGAIGEAVDPAVAERCDAALTTEFADTGPLLLAAGITWRGAPGVVLVHELTDSDGGRAVAYWIYATDDCRLLSFARL